jgi:mannan endo-1,4-beta-mannosidase
MTGSTGRRAGASVLVCLALATAVAGCGRFASGATGAASTGARPAHHEHSAPATPPVNMAALTDPPTGKYFGVEANGPPGSLAPIQAFASLAGHKPDLIGDYVGWNTPFDAAAARSAWSYGALYYLAWEPFSTTLADIAAGRSNRYISQFARQVKAAGVPIAISFGHEMNGDWYPWGSTDASPASFVAAWRLIHAIFAADGATDVVWIWNPNVISASDVPLRPYYPGNAYVTWVGLTGYFPMSGPVTFSQLFGSTIDEIRHFTRKPFIVVETAVQTGPNDVTCTRNLVTGVLRRSDMLGLVWFEFDKGGVNWSLADRPAVRHALVRAMIGYSVINVRQA